MKENIPSGLKSISEIIWSHTPNSEYTSYYHESDIEKMMEEYAKQFQPPSSTSVKVEELAKECGGFNSPKEFDEFAFKNGVKEYSGSLEKFAVDNFKAGFLAASPKGKEDIKCKCKDSSGQTSVMCCNDCGLPTEEFWTKGK